MALILKNAFNDVLLKYSGGPGGEKTGGGDEIPTTVILGDVSGSTFFFMDRHRLMPLLDGSQRNDPRLCDGSGFIVQTAISDAVGRLSDELEARTANSGEKRVTLGGMGAERGLLDCLGDMMGQSDHHPYVMVTVGNPEVPALVHETSNPKSTMKIFRDEACAPGTDDRKNITYGTSLKGAFSRLLSSGYVERAKRDGRNTDVQRFHIFTDGLCTDGTAETATAFRAVLDVFPNALFEIHAFVLNVKPDQENLTETKLGKVAGLDAFQRINESYPKNVSCFTVYYLLKRNGERYTIAEEPDPLLLAVGQEAGASMTFTCLETKVVIPKDNVTRHQMVLDLIEVLMAHPEDIAAIKPLDMKETLENLATLAKHMRETVLQNALAALVTKWFCAMNPQANYTKSQLKKDAYEFLQRYIFIPRQNALLEGNGDEVQLRTQDQRKANFKTILHYWDVLKNPVITKLHVGRYIVLVDTRNVGRMACVTLTNSLLKDHYDAESFLFFDHYVPVLDGIGSADYFRMAIRRIFGRVAWGKGVRLPKVPSADKMAMLPHMVGCVALLSASARSAGEGPLSEALMHATTTMLQKEQLDNRSKPPRTLPSCHQMLERDEGIPNEYASLKMLQPDPAALLLYACGLSDQKPANSVLSGVPSISTDLLQQPKIVDMITYDDIDAENTETYYHYKGRGEYVSKETYAQCIGMRSPLGGVYTEGDFVEVAMNHRDTYARLLQWASAATEGDVTLASLFA